MQNILSIVNELQSTSSKLGKLDILKRESNNESFKKFIKYTLDPLYVYGIQDKKLKKYINKTDRFTDFNNLFEVFEYLLEHNTGRDIDAKLVVEFIDATTGDNEELRTLYIEALTKKLRMGIDSTVNKAWGKGFLNEFKVMLAKNYYDESHKVEGKEFALTEKLDGMRAVIFNRDGIISIFSRQGKAVTGLIEIENSVRQLPEGVYDGELLIKDEHLYKDREVLQETLKLSRKDGEKTGLNFWVFDYLTHEEFNNGISEHGYFTRRNLNPLRYTSIPHIELIRLVYRGTDLSFIPEYLTVLEEEGKEGLMLNLDVPYQCKRTDGLLKIKTMQTADLRIIGFELGKVSGKYEHTLGTLIVDYKGYDLGVSGFTDKMRDEIWNNQDEYLGLIVEVAYFRESKNDNGGLSVSFPQFKGVRYDKTEPSYY